MTQVMPIVALCTVFAVLVRWSVSLNGYSGAGKSPMYGDYEAQRHWMEITYNLPVKDWYVNGTDNDLMYWGLDYPPLTAYHSWLCAAIAKKINPAWVELYESRGFESYTHKLFMRYSVLVTDLLLYFPAVFLYFLAAKGTTAFKDQMLSCAVMLLYPGLILIDYGHFQYNSVSLGFALWGVIGLARGHDLLGSIAFCLALNYKQMELYHAFPFFFYLLGSSFKSPQNWFLKLTKLGVVVIATFALCWLPFLQDPKVAEQVLHRLFPFARGLYEDKVANFWCSISLVIKLKQLFNVQTLIKICAGATLGGLVPSSLHLLFRPTILNFKLSLINCSLIFFLFSFQVHEKSILIPAMSACLLLTEQPLAVIWFLLISTFSMLPLLVKDELLQACAGATALFFVVAMWSLHRDQRQADSTAGETPVSHQQTLLHVLFVLSMLGALVLTVLSVMVAPPSHLPDLYPVLVSAYSCAHFCLFTVYFHWLQFTSKVTPEVTQHTDRSGHLLRPSIRKDKNKKKKA